MHKIIPGILEKDWQEIERKLEIIRPFSKTVHIDFLDGKFCEESSFMDIQSFSKYGNDFFMEAHLMVENPTEYVKPLASVGFKRFLGQIEKMQDTDEFIAEGEIFGEVGLALDIDTPPSAITVPFDDIDAILLMSVKAGKSGQVFSPQVISKIQELRSKTQIPIAMDGGINEQTLTEAKNAGANRFVTTSFIFKSEDPLNAFERLSSLAR